MLDVVIPARFAGPRQSRAVPLLAQPPNVPWDPRVPVPSVCLNLNYYLCDVDEELGPTEFIPGVLNYDFSGSSFDKAFVEWSGYLGATPVAVDMGLRWGRLSNLASDRLFREERGSGGVGGGQSLLRRGDAAVPAEDQGI